MPFKVNNHKSSKEYEPSGVDRAINFDVNEARGGRGWMITSTTSSSTRKKEHEPTPTISNLIEARGV